jgi:hypothetical protein
MECREGLKNTHKHEEYGYLACSNNKKDVRK